MLSGSEEGESCEGGEEGCGGGGGGGGGGEVALLVQISQCWSYTWLPCCAVVLVALEEEILPPPSLSRSRIPPPPPPPVLFLESEWLFLDPAGLEPGSDLIVADVSSSDVAGVEPSVTSIGC